MEKGGVPFTIRLETNAEPRTCAVLCIVIWFAVIAFVLIPSLIEREFPIRLDVVSATTFATVLYSGNPKVLIIFQLDAFWAEKESDANG